VPHDVPALEKPSSEAVLKQCGAWIYRAARRIRDRMPWADLDELVQQGIMIALEQRERYAPERGVPFLAFIKPRVFGAMIDLMRTAGAASRTAASFSELGAEDEESALEIIIRQEDIENFAGGRLPQSGGEDGARALLSGGADEQGSRDRNGDRRKPRDTSAPAGDQAACRHRLSRRRFAGAQ